MATADHGGQQLDGLTSVELAATAATMLLIPLGATEQHGPHLPLGTDTFLAGAWADRLAEALNRGIGAEDPSRRAVVAPALPFGSSGEHQSFPGTLSIGQDALEHVLVELVRSAVGDFRRVVLLSGHAGNLEPVRRATNRMTDEGHDVRHFFPSWPISGPVPTDAHAGRTETSLMLHVRPGDVRPDLLAPGNTEPLSKTMATMASDGVAAVSPSGVLGDPTLASSEEGLWLLNSLVERTVTALTGNGEGSAPQYDSDRPG